MAPITSYPEFDESKTATEAAKAFSEQIKGKNVLLVGVSPNSLGEYMSLAIASHNPALFILASRTSSKINTVIQKITNTTSTIPKPILVNLSSQSSIGAAAKDITPLIPKLDIIINNAALNVPDYQETNEGIESHFGVNHIGLFLLTNLLMPFVLVSASTSPPGHTRIVNLTSAGHRLSPVRFSDINFKKLHEEIPEDEQPPKGLPEQFLKGEEGLGSYNGFLAYGQSKTANILFSVSLNETLGARGVGSVSVHPGCEYCFSLHVHILFPGRIVLKWAMAVELSTVSKPDIPLTAQAIWTGLSRNLTEEGRNVIKNTGTHWKNGDEGAAGTIVAAFDPALNNLQGVYMADCQYVEASPFTTNSKMAARLWSLSEDLVGEKFSMST